MDLTQFIQATVTGLSTGGTYALVALGFVLIFGVANVLNIAHAETVMLAPVFAIVLVSDFGFPNPVALVAAVLLTVVAGSLIHAVAVQPFVLRERQNGKVDALAPLIATFGASLAISHAAGQYFGTSARPFTFNLASTTWNWGGVRVAPSQVVSLVVVLALTAGIGILVYRSQFGRSMRAVAENSTVAESMGIDVGRIVLLTTALAAFLGGVAGILFAAGSNSVTAYMGIAYGLKGLVVMIVGGVSSPSGAFVGGLLLGLIEAYTITYFSPTYVTVVTFGLLFLVLIARPRGLVAAAAQEARP